MSPERSNSLQNLVTKDDLTEILINVIKLNFPLSEVFPCSPLIFTSPNQKLNALLNEIKEKTLKCFNLLFEFVVNLKEINLTATKINIEATKVLEEVFQAVLKVVGNNEIKRTVIIIFFIYFSIPISFTSFFFLIFLI